MRWFARAQVFARLGDPRRALAYYEVLDPARLTVGTPAVPTVFSEFGR